MNSNISKLKWFKFTLFVCLSFSLFSCSNDEEPISFEIQANESDLVFLEDGGASKIMVLSDGEWTVDANVEWCRVTPANGKGKTVCEILVDSSYLYQERTANLTFQTNNNKTQQIDIYQFGYQKVIELDSTSFIVPDFSDYNSMFRKMKVRSNVKYEIIIPSSENWLTVKTDAGKVGSIPRTSNVRFDYEIYNEFRADRQAEVIFRQTDAKEGETPIESKLTFVQKAAQKIVPSRAGDSLAILAIARAINCHSTFDSSQSMIYWSNVELEDMEYLNEDNELVSELRVVGVQFFMFNTNRSIPYQVRYLDQLRTLVFIGNENAHRKYIPIEDEYIANLKHLESFALVGYGAANIPESLSQITSLKELDFNGNHLVDVPEQLIKNLDNNGLEYLNLSNNTYKSFADNKPSNHQSATDSIGMTGTLPEYFFHLRNVKYLYLSYNNFIGSIPNVEPLEGEQYVLPKIRALSLNLNFLSGMIPEWMLNHPNIKCWDPYTLIFNQRENGRDESGARVGFRNEPESIDTDCPLVDSDGNWIDDSKESLTPASFRGDYFWHNRFDPNNPYAYKKLSLRGHWSGMD